MIAALFWVSICSILIIVPTAIAARVLHEFSRAELESYCRRRNQQELFDEVLDSHDQFALGAEALQWFGNACFLITSCLWLFSDDEMFFGSGGEFFVNLPQAYELGICIAAYTLFLVLVNSWIPWAVVKLASAPFLFHTWGLWQFVSQLAWPFRIGYAGMTFFANRIAGHVDDEDAEEEALEEEIRSIVTAGERDGLLESPAREMIEGVIELDDIDVGEIMTPRSKVNSLDINLRPEDLIRQAIEFGHTRIPIFEDELDNVVGLLFVKDLLPILSKAQAEDADIRSCLRPAQFVPMSIQGDALLQRFRSARSHLSIVVDEYQSVVGVVTIEDVLEEIVGEITDETDKVEQPEFIKVDDDTTEVMATVHIDDVNEFMKIDLPNSDEFDTLAGFVMTRFGRIPKSGEAFVEGNVRIEVQQSTRRKIERLRLSIFDENDASDAGKSSRI